MSQQGVEAHCRDDVTTDAAQSWKAAARVALAILAHEAIEGRVVVPEPTGPAAFGRNDAVEHRDLGQVSRPGPEHGLGLATAFNEKCAAHRTQAAKACIAAIAGAHVHKKIPRAWLLCAGGGVQFGCRHDCPSPQRVRRRAAIRRAQCLHISDLTKRLASAALAVIDLVT